MIAVAIIAIMLAVIEGSLSPSDACNMYPNVINEHATAGSSVII